MKTIKKLTLNKTIVSSLTREQSGKIRGGGGGGEETGYVCASVDTAGECDTAFCNTYGDSICIACTSEFGITCGMSLDEECMSLDRECNSQVIICY